MVDIVFLVVALTSIGGIIIFGVVCTLRDAENIAFKYQQAIKEARHYKAEKDRLEAERLETARRLDAAIQERNDYMSQNKSLRETIADLTRGVDSDVVAR